VQLRPNRLWPSYAASAYYVGVVVKSRPIAASLPSPASCSSCSSFLSQLAAAPWEIIMIRTLGRHVFALLSVSSVALAAKCSQTCFEPGGSLDPNAVTNSNLFRYRMYHCCELHTCSLGCKRLTVLKLSWLVITSILTEGCVHTHRMILQPLSLVCFRHQSALPVSALTFYRPVHVFHRSISGMDEPNCIPQSH
jgi:hypothetical protein